MELTKSGPLADSIDRAWTKIGRHDSNYFVYLVPPNRVACCRKNTHSQVYYETEGFMLIGVYNNAAHYGDFVDDVFTAAAEAVRKGRF